MYPAEVLKDEYVIDEPDYVIYQVIPEPKTSPWGWAAFLLGLVLTDLPFLDPWRKELWYLVATKTRGTLVHMGATKPPVKASIPVPDWNPDFMRHFDSVTVEGRRYTNSYSDPVRSQDDLR